METIEIVKLFRSKGKLIKPNAVKRLVEKNDKEILEIAEKIEKNKDVTVSEMDIRRLSDHIKVPDFAESDSKEGFNPTILKYGHNISFYPERDVTGKSKCSGKLLDFVRYFNDRLRRIRKVLTSRPSRIRTAFIGTLEKIPSGEKVRLIGLVAGKGTTKKGHIFIELEDETGTASVLVIKDKKRDALFKKASAVVNDGVIAVDIKKMTNYNIVNEITWPDMPIKSKKRIDKDISIAFISDLHIGSKFFNDREFERMIKWISGEIEEGREVAEKIGYLFIAGDLVDGIGKYPKHEDDLEIKDIYEQYKLFNKFLGMIPEHIHVILIPGSHDAVRNSEPQPALSQDIIKSTDRIHSLGNPAYVNIEGFRCLLYYGASMDSLISDIPGQSYAKPEEVIIEMLKRRNLCPIYEKNEIAPEHHDYLFIEDIDIIQCGHVHRNGYSEYRGTVVINSGTWLDKTTEWQLKRGFVPTPCIMPIYNLKTGRIAHVDFNQDEVRVIQ